jgi:hypothetical protein
MDHSIGRGRAALQARQILKRAAMNIGSGGREGFCGRIGASKAEYLVSCTEQFPDDG